MHVLVAVGALAALLSGCSIHPEPFSEIEIARAAEQNAVEVDAGQEPVVQAIGLHEAMARALKYNLDFRVEAMQQSLRVAEMDLSHWSLLPNAVANSGYAARDNYSASFSTRVLPGDRLDPSPIPEVRNSTSQEKRINSADIGFSWNVLDFGLSYVRARQAADKVLIQNELRRKIALRIMEDTRAAFWRAVSAQRLLGKLQRVEADARAVETEARRLATDQQTSQITALTYEREIVEIQRTIGELTRELNTALAELGALMNVAPGTVYRVTGTARPLPRLPGSNMAELVHMAVMNRPELKEVEYRRRINEHEAHAALLELLPGVNLVAASNYDSNSFLLHNDWVNWGARASWNLLKVFSYPARRDVVEEQERLLQTKSLAVTMAIMTQVYVSRIRYAHALKEHRIAKKYRDVQTNLLSQIRAEAEAGRVARQTLVREELNAVVAEARLDIAYAGVQGAYANVETSLGLDPFVGLVPADTGVKGIASALRSGRSAAIETASIDP